MEGSSKKKKKQPATAGACGGRPARPHWRQRDPADTSLYVVQPDQFRAVVQQLTGAAASSSPAAAPHHQGANEGTTEAQQTMTQAIVGMDTNAQQHAGGGEVNGSSNKGKTFGELHDECMAWANADD